MCLHQETLALQRHCIAWLVEVKSLMQESMNDSMNVRRMYRHTFQQSRIVANSTTTTFDVFCFVFFFCFVVRETGNCYFKLLVRTYCGNYLQQRSFFFFFGMFLTVLRERLKSGVQWKLKWKNKTKWLSVMCLVAFISLAFAACLSLFGAVCPFKCQEVCWWHLA